MNAPAIIPTSLPALVDRAASQLAEARSSAEVLEARDSARLAYDAAKSAARIAKAKSAHDDIIVTVYRTQANALDIEAAAKRRLAEEYDAAQERGDVASQGKPSSAEGFTTAADIGLTHKDIHEARQLRDAEEAHPGITRRTLDGLLERGEEPTKAALRREIIARPEPRVSDDSLWLWGRLRDFDGKGILSAEPSRLLAGMTEPMRADVRRLVPLVREFLEEMEVAYEPA